MIFLSFRNTQIFLVFHIFLNFIQSHSFLLHEGIYFMLLFFIIFRESFECFILLFINLFLQAFFFIPIFCIFDQSNLLLFICSINQFLSFFFYQVINIYLIKWTTCTAWNWGFIIHIHGAFLFISSLTHCSVFYVH